MNEFKRLLANPDEAHELIGRLGEAFNNLSDQLVKTLAPLIEKFAEFAEQIYKLMWARYREAGMPYGDSDDGMIRWFHEQASIYYAITEAHEELAWREAIADLRKRFGHN